MAWVVKGIRGPPFSVLHSFYKQRMSMMLWQAQVNFIPRCVVIVVDGSFILGVLLGVFTHSIFDMHLAIRDRFKYLIYSYSRRDPPSLKYSPFVKTWVFPSCTFFPPLLGVLFY